MLIGIYYLIPVFFYKKKYTHFISGLLLLLFLDLAISYYVTGILLYEFVSTFLGTMDFAYLYTMWIVIVTLVAIGIKITKRWYLQERENLEISRRKKRMEAQRQKANIQPEFLFQTLNNIKEQIGQKNSNAANTVLSLADILSYSLYDSDLELVPTEMELSYLQEYIKIQAAYNENISISIEIKDEILETYIPPMLLLSLFQEYISVVNGIENNRGNIIINVGRRKDMLSVEIYSPYKLSSMPQVLLQLQNAIEALTPLYSSAVYHLAPAGLENGLSLQLLFPFITDPYAMSMEAQHALKSKEYENV
jgi:LytS/YehU family sensor histidine kinase